VHLRLNTISLVRLAEELVLSRWAMWLTEVLSPSALSAGAGYLPCLPPLPALWLPHEMWSPS
jgi:hypothetical protein